MRALLIGLLFLLAPTAAWAERVLCPTETIVDAAHDALLYVCRFEIENGETVTADFQAPLYGLDPRLYIRADYGDDHPGEKIDDCIKDRPAFLRGDRVVYKIISRCKGEKYLLLELNIPLRYLRYLGETVPVTRP